MRRFPRCTTFAWKSLLVLPIFTVAVLAVVAGPSYNAAHVMDTPLIPLTVAGHVYDLAGQPLEGANVVVTIVETGGTASGVTDSTGAYVAQPDIPVDKYDLGNTIRVVATYNSAQETVNVPVNQSIHDYGIATIDVHYTYEIPEFGSGLGLAFALVAVAAVGFVLVGRKRLQ